MVKGTQKPGKIQNNTINSVLTKNKFSPKSKQQIDKEHYQKNKEKKKNSSEKDTPSKNNRNNWQPANTTNPVISMC